MKVLIIGFVWPEPNSSAAGSRMMQLIALFKEQKWDVCFASPSATSMHMVDLNAMGIDTQEIILNHDSFDEYILSLQPDIVLFDRFMIEEQFGWRVAKQCPNALRVLDTEDLHCLRKTRQEAFKKNIAFKEEYLLDSELAKRELASIYRCDLSLIISTYEMQLLHNVFKVDLSLIYYLPFLLEKVNDGQLEELPTYEERQNFICIGNFRHEPNWDMTLYLKETIWPLIRKVLPKTELHVYGAYPSAKVMQLHNDQQGFVIKGWTEDADKEMQNARVCLAPLRFGAGIKGKFVEAMQNGTPSVTTSIGAEGMNDNLPWSGFIANSAEEIAQQAIKLYQDKGIWQEAQVNGKVIINSIYNRESYSNSFIQDLINIKDKLKQHRVKNFIGGMLQHHTLQSTKYLSKWIAEKNNK